MLPEPGVGVQSATLGLAGPKVACITNLTCEVPSLLQLLCRWFRESCAEHIEFTSIQLNLHFSCRRHRDFGNIGTSATKALGDFGGGNLIYWPWDDKETPLGALDEDHAVTLDTRQWCVFDGTKAHQAQPYEGTRVSLVFFQSTAWRWADDDTKWRLAHLGVNLPLDRDGGQSFGCQ